MSRCAAILDRVFHTPLWVLVFLFVVGLSAKLGFDLLHRLARPAGPASVLPGRILGAQDLLVVRAPGSESKETLLDPEDAGVPELSIYAASKRLGLFARPDTDSATGNGSLKLSYTLDTGGWVSIELPVTITSGEHRFLELVMKGDGHPASLRIAVKDWRGRREFDAWNHLVLQRRAWRRIRIPLAAFSPTDGSDRSLIMAPGDLILSLCFHPFFQHAMEKGLHRRTAWLDAVYLD